MGHFAFVKKQAMPCKYIGYVFEYRPLSPKNKI
jgi:hypothetical protein